MRQAEGVSYIGSVLKSYYIMTENNKVLFWSIDSLKLSIYVINASKSYGIQANASNQSLDTSVTVYYGNTDGGIGTGDIVSYCIKILSIYDNDYPIISISLLQFDFCTGRSIKQLPLTSHKSLGQNPEPQFTTTSGVSFPLIYILPSNEVNDVFIMNNFGNLGYRSPSIVLKTLNTLLTCQLQAFVLKLNIHIGPLLAKYAALRGPKVQLFTSFVLLLKQFDSETGILGSQV
ncbi:MAG: hypothetical protein EZS28_017487 [Streblomastix strix]|uniref:Uncharacterized protein n=1 Tax=Streblomastix strix TaxID=222440 RepID=A0A5J4VWR0_9EUKA|nr:MAG: hypothetical protein EZS28_017487 [Streblomastix strix]